MRNKKLFVGFIVAVVMLLVAETYIYLNYSNLKKQEIKISVVLSGDNMDKWENLIAGAETAAIDEECVVDFISSPLEHGTDGEIENINRQFEEGADYVLVASSDYETLRDYAIKRGYGNKLIFLKNGIYGQDNLDILTDDYQLGCEFGTYIIEEAKAKKLIMVTTVEDVNTNELRRGIEDTLKDSDIKLDYRLMSSTSGTLNQSMFNLGQSGIYSGFITLDFDTMEAASKAKGKLKDSLLVYSIDNSKESVYFLDSNIINGLAFKDDYSIGFVAVKKVLGGKEEMKYETDNLYYIANKDSIHSEKMEKVLFPFVK